MSFSLKTLRLLKEAGASGLLLNDIMVSIQADFGVTPENMQLPVEPRAVRRSRRHAPVSAEKRRAVYERDDFTCVYCGNGDPFTVSTLTVDHRLPRSRGGTNDLDNLATACSKCNHEKADFTVEEFSSGQHRPKRTPALPKHRASDRDVVMEARRALVAASIARASEFAAPFRERVCHDAGTVQEAERLRKNRNYRAPTL